MRIGFDANALFSPTSKNRGIGNYCTAMLSDLVRRFPQHEFFMLNLCDSCSFAPFVEGCDNFSEQYFYVPSMLDGADREAIRALYGDIVSSFVAEHDLDLFLVTSPFDNLFPVYSRDWFGNTAVAVIVYDIIPYIFKERYLPTPELMNDYYMPCVDFLRTADRLCVISQSVKDDLCSYLGFDGGTIDVIWGAVSESFCVREPDEQLRRSLCERFGIRGEFIICTGGDDHRKNIDGLICAYSDLSAELRRRYQLVVVCKLSTESQEKYTRLARSHGVGNDVILTNFVSDEELIELCNMASLCAFVSKYEGFGMPIVEAWQCDTPVVTSNCSSLVQIAGDAAVIVDPHDRRSITDGLSLALAPEELQRLTQKGRERMKLYTWERVAAALMDSFGNIDISRPRRRIAMFSPMPPMHSGIADYTFDIADGLRELYDIDLFVEDIGKVDPLPDGMTGVQMYPHRSYRRESYDHTIFQMGNSDFHFYMYPYIEKGTDIVVLHDLNLTNSMRLYTSVNQSPQTMERWLHEDFPTLPAHAAYDDTYPLVLNGFVTNHAKKLIVHSGYSKRELLRRDFSRQVRFLPMYARIEPMRDKVQARRELGLPENAVIFAAFGHIYTTKRSIPSLEGFYRFLDRYSESEAHLVFAGEVSEHIREEFYGAIERLGLADKATVTGYTDMDTFLRYIDAADMCLSLRYPYNGETSGSLTRVLAKGVPVMVNDIGSFAEIPKECCVRLPDVAAMTEQQEQDAIADAMLDFASDAAARRSLSEGARRFAEERLELSVVVRRLARYIDEPVRSGAPMELYDRLIAHERGCGGGRLGLLLDSIAYSKNPFGDEY